MKDILIIKPVFQHRIWGGNTLKSWYPLYNVEDQTGECWAISAHENGMSTIMNTTFEGTTLKELYANHAELFGNPKEPVFPLLVKILDAENDLSVQVHPDDAYGMRVEGELGKTECWYVLDCKEDATIIYGHTATSKEDFQAMVDAGEWNDLLVEVPIKKGDFFFVPSGTIHALKTGTLVLEVQQSSDTTYRLYDYDRRDDTGNLRELHIDKSIEVTTIPHKNVEITQQISDTVNATNTELVETEFFTVNKIDVHGTYTYERNAPYILATIIAGEGTINEHALTRGDSFIIPNTLDAVECVGNFSMITSHN